jgi:tRNA (cytidine/uridine-2'-O-)-methyltransferase
MAAERHVVLFSPQVHWNTGNIGRTCLGAGAYLHLIHPLGFSLDSRQVKRAGLDYWSKVPLKVWQSFDEFKHKINPQQDEIFLLTKNGSKPYWEIPTLDRQYLVFGSETHGLPQQILDWYNQSTYHIPISNEIRSLNLSTAVGIVLYDSLRHFRPPHGWPNT